MSGKTSSTSATSSYSCTRAHNNTLSHGEAPGKLCFTQMTGRDQQMHSESCPAFLRIRLPKKEQLGPLRFTKLASQFMAFKSRLRMAASIQFELREPFCLSILNLVSQSSQAMASRQLTACDTLVVTCWTTSKTAGNKKSSARQKRLKGRGAKKKRGT